MTRANLRSSSENACEVIDFDKVLLAACSAEERAELLGEARILAQAFADNGSADEIEAIAQILSHGDRDGHMSRAHARKLSAALRRLAADPWA